MANGLSPGIKSLSKPIPKKKGKKISIHLSSSVVDEFIGNAEVLYDIPDRISKRLR